MSHFGDGNLEQALLDWTEMEMKERGADALEIIAALARVIEAITERHGSNVGRPC